MLKNNEREKERMSMRESVFLWVGGAVFGWALLMVSVYNVVRFDDPTQVGPQTIAEAEAERLNEILPAAGTMPESQFETEEIIITPEDVDTEEDSGEQPMDEETDDDPDANTSGLNALSPAAGNMSSDSAFTMDEIIITPSQAESFNALLPNAGQPMSDSAFTMDEIIITPADAG